MSIEISLEVADQIKVERHNDLAWVAEFPPSAVVESGSWDKRPASATRPMGAYASIPVSVSGGALISARGRWKRPQGKPSRVFLCIDDHRHRKGSHT